MSLAALHATKIRRPSLEGCAHVGEQVFVPAGGGSLPCPAACAPWSVAAGAPGRGAPVCPVSPPDDSVKWRDTFSVPVSISTSVSSIMHAEYCFVPCGLIRDPCGMRHVLIRATSRSPLVATTDTVEGTRSPCRLKLTT